MANKTIILYWARVLVDILLGGLCFAAASLASPEHPLWAAISLGLGQLALADAMDAAIRWEIADDASRPMGAIYLSRLLMQGLLSGLVLWQLVDLALVREPVAIWILAAVIAISGYRASHYLSRLRGARAAERR